MFKSEHKRMVMYIADACRLQKSFSLNPPLGRLPDFIEVIPSTSRPIYLYFVILIKIFQECLDNSFIWTEKDLFKQYE